tara:strand:+ start:111 stop:359 length:249 start_codon:yes stop_codon:yes gene_type:complete
VVAGVVLLILQMHLMVDQVVEAELVGLLELVIHLQLLQLKVHPVHRLVALVIQVVVEVQQLLEQEVFLLILVEQVEQEQPLQ